LKKSVKEIGDNYVYVIDEKKLMSLVTLEDFFEGSPVHNKAIYVEGFMFGWVIKALRFF
jgi:hypothetical protein